MNTEELAEELQSSFRTKKVSLKWPFGEIVFERDEFQKLFEVQDHVAEVVNKSFVERWVMHYDLTKEDVGESIKSLNDNASFLDSKIKELRGKLPAQVNGLVRLLEEFRSA